MIAFFAPYDGGNLGDQAIMSASVGYFEHNHPEVDIVLFTARPSKTKRIHGHAGHLLSPGPEGGYYALARQDAVDSVRSDDADNDRADGSSAPESSGSSLRERLKAWMSHVPWLLATARGLRRTLDRIRYEIRHARDTLRVLDRVDAFVVNGGGQIDDEWGGPTKHPVAVAKMAILCKLSSTPFFMLSVGVCRVDSPISRLLFRLALRIARRVTVRDEGSLELLDAWADGDDVMVVPDLAFAFGESRDSPGPEPTTAASPIPVDEDPGSRTVIAVSPITYRHPERWSHGDETAFAEYRSILLSYMTRQARSGREVRIFVTSPMEWELAESLASEMPEDVRELTRCYVPDGYEDGMSTLRDALEGADVAVASRLHGVILSHLVGKPTLAISYDRKVDAHMRDIGQDDVLIDFDAISSDLLCRTTDTLLDQQEARATLIRDAVEARKEKVEAQFECLASSLPL